MTYYSTRPTHSRVAKCDRIVKVDEDQQLVFGWANVIEDESGQTILDRQADFIDSADELEKAAYDYVLHSRDGGEMHVRKGVATMVESMVLTKEKQHALGIPPGTIPVGWWLGFKVNDEAVWAEVKKGEYIGFSVHGKGKREPVEIDSDLFSTDGPVRKMAGHEFPAAAFAHVEDLSKPGNWRLRIWENVEKKLTPRQVNRAIMLYSRDPEKYDDVARDRLAKAFRAVEPAAELPEILEAPGMSDLDRKRLLVKARTAAAIAKHAGGGHDQKSHGNWASGGSGGGGGGGKGGKGKKLPPYRGGGEVGGGLDPQNEKGESLGQRQLPGTSRREMKAAARKKAAAKAEAARKKRREVGMAQREYSEKTRAATEVDPNPKPKKKRRAVDRRGRHISVGDTVDGGQGRWQVDEIKGGKVKVYDAKTKTSSWSEASEVEVET